MVLSCFLLHDWMVERAGKCRKYKNFILPAWIIKAHMHYRRPTIFIERWSRPVQGAILMPVIWIRLTPKIVLWNYFRTKIENIWSAYKLIWGYGNILSGNISIGTLSYHQHAPSDQMRTGSKFWDWMHPQILLKVQSAPSCEGSSAGVLVLTISGGVPQTPSAHASFCCLKAEKYIVDNAINYINLSKSGARSPNAR